MAELDEFNDFIKAMDDYNKVQLRQTIDFYSQLKDYIENSTEEDVLSKFEETWLGIQAKEDM